jgi:hypothetical protein
MACDLLVGWFVVSTYMKNIIMSMGFLKNYGKNLTCYIFGDSIMSMDLIFILITAAVAVIAVFIRLYSDYENPHVVVLDRVKDNFKILHQTYDLNFIKGTFRKIAPLKGKINGNLLIIKLVKKSAGYFYQIIIHPQKDKSYSLILTKRSLYIYYKLEMHKTSELKMPKSNYKPVSVADPYCLRNVIICSKDENTAVGLLNTETRKRIDFINDCTVEFNVKEKEMKVLLKAKGIKMRDLEKILGELHKLSLQLEDGKNIYNLLLHNACHDPVPEVRKHNLSILVGNYRDKKQTKQILNKSLKDRNFEVSLFAAKSLGKDIFKQVVRIINTLDPSEKIKAIKMLGREKIKQSVDFLIDFFQQTRSNYIKTEIIKAFKEFEDSKANELLIEQLQRKFSDIRPAAVDALAACGKKSAIAPLHKIVRDTTAPVNLRKKAEYAISQIRSRIGETGEGWLSVAAPSPAEGSLSLKEKGKAGGLSVAETNPSQEEGGKE